MEMGEPENEIFYSENKKKFDYNCNAPDEYSRSDEESESEEESNEEQDIDEEGEVVRSMLKKYFVSPEGYAIPVGTHVQK